MRGISEIFFYTLESLGRREFDIASWLSFLFCWSWYNKVRFSLHFMPVFIYNLNITTILQRSRSSFVLSSCRFYVAWWYLDSLNPFVSRTDFFILFGSCKTRYYTIKKQSRSRCFSDKNLVIFQPHNNLYNVTCSNLIVSTLMAIMDTLEDMYSL